MIKDFGLIRLIDARLVPEEQEASTPGAAVAGMILKGLGFANRPLSLTPPFFPNQPLDVLWCPGVRAAMCHRLTRGRTLDAGHAYGGALLVSALALAGWAQARLTPRCPHLDTTSFARRGDEVPESDAPAMCLTHGSATAHRPDLPQAVCARLVSHEGGVPLVSKRWAGKTSDTQIVQARAEAWLAAVARSPTPRYLVADAPLDPEDPAAPLAQLGFSTRMPGTRKLVSQVLTQALQWDRWHRLDETTRSAGLELCHYGMAQRWLVVSSQAAMPRAEAGSTTAQQRAWDASEQPLLPLHAQRFEPPEAAHAALTALSTAWRSPQLDTSQGIDHTRSAGQGRPTSTRPLKALAWQMPAQVRPAQEVIEAHQQQRAGLVMGTNIAARHVGHAEVIRADKAPSGVEGGCRWLKDPRCFVSSVVVKKPAIPAHGLLSSTRDGNGTNCSDFIPHFGLMRIEL